MPLDSEPGGGVVIIGAGPAGLTAGYELVRNGHQVLIVEADPRYVGGLARTVEYRGFRFDIGGHRFFSKNGEIEQWWTEVMGERMLVRRRLSRIYYRGRFFKYPLEPLDAFTKLGPLEAASCLLSYLRERLSAGRCVRSFEDWVVNAFGRRLYETFFRSYTEKVWGMPCDRISADWAAQRIKGLSLTTLIGSLMPGRNHNGAIIKTLVDRFRYPPHGPGEVWERVAALIVEKGGTVRRGERVVAIVRNAHHITSITTQGANGFNTYRGDYFISTMPLSHLIAALKPSAPEEVIASAKALRYRNFITVAIILDQAEVFPDNWIYIHEPRVRVARIQNFKNWSAEMVPDPRFTILGLEYFCSEDDSLWAASDQELIAIARDELASLGFADASRIIDGTVVRHSMAYPLYDHDYRNHVTVLRSFLELETGNLQVAGRNGMHKYNNQDHAMMTGLMAGRNIMGSSFDLWRVNSDAEYVEEEPGTATDNGRMQPSALNDNGDVAALPILDLAPSTRDN